MNIEDVKRRVQEIHDNADDPESAHGMEDALYVDVLRAIATANHVETAEDLADWALEAQKIDFPRWCA